MAIRPISAAFLASLLVSTLCPASQQRPDPVPQAIEKDGCTTASDVRICRYDFSLDGRNVEAISFQPAGEGPFPGALLIPGYQRTAKNLVPLGTQLAAAGFAAVAVSQPGFGGSEGPADYVGPSTIAALRAGYEKLRKERWVDSSRMAIYGYSRGAIAASLLALDLPDLKAAVFGAGAYDFQRLYNDAVLPGVRGNMKAETGMTPAAIR
jgi:pimeloyl-ACP methyl ester carboxylesterase